MALGEGQEFLSQDWVIRIANAFVLHPEAESVFDACYGIPTQYMDDAEAMWARLRKNREENPPPEGTVYWTPSD